MQNIVNKLNSTAVILEKKYPIKIGLLGGVSPPENSFWSHPSYWKPTVT